MEMGEAITIGRDLMVASLLLVAPVVVVSLVVGLLISIAQTVTSIQEQTLTFAPRIVAVVGIVIFLTPWYLKRSRRSHWACLKECPGSRSNERTGSIFLYSRFVPSVRIRRFLSALLASSVAGIW